MKDKGIVLIDVLILTALIAILAAITVPNYQAIILNSKISKAHNDMRNIACALAGYQVDYFDYPEDTGTGLIYGNSYNARVSLKALSTPVAYIQKIPIDIFRDKLFTRLPDTQVYCYFCLNTTYPASVWNAPAPWSYVLFSYGPDELSSWAMPYDPSNGLVSNGDLRRFGPPKDFPRK